MRTSWLAVCSCWRACAQSSALARYRSATAAACSRAAAAAICASASSVLHEHRAKSWMTWESYWLLLSDCLLKLAD